MSKLLIEQSTLVGIADAVRGHEGTSDPIPVSELKERIEAIQTGVELPELSNPGSADDVLAGKEVIDADGNIIVGTIESKSAETYVPGTEDRTISSGLYLAGDQVIRGDPNLTPENIVEGIAIFDVVGTREPASNLSEELVAQDDLIAQIAVALEGKTAAEPAVTPVISVGSDGLITATAGSKSATKQLATQASTTITPGVAEQTAVPSGVWTIGDVTVLGDSNLVADNIKSGISIFGVAGSYSAALPMCTVSVTNNTTDIIVICTDQQIKRFVTKGGTTTVQSTAGSAVTIICNDADALCGDYSGAEYIDQSSYVSGNSTLVWKIDPDATTAMVEAVNLG